MTSPDLLDILEGQIREWFPNISITLQLDGNYKDLLIWAPGTSDQVKWCVCITQGPPRHKITYDDGFGYLDFTGEYDPSNPEFLNNLEKRITRAMKRRPSPPRLSVHLRGSSMGLDKSDGFDLGGEG